jgi:GntR family phosphonate transport system transcriptional regulator
VAKELMLEPSAKVLMVEMLDEASGHPIGLATAYYPAIRFDGLLDMLSAQGEGNSTTDILRHFGVEDYVRAKSQITTQMPSDETARLLKQPATRPVICVEGLDVDMKGQPIKYGETVFSGDRVQLVISTESDT